MFDPPPPVCPWVHIQLYIGILTNNGVCGATIEPILPNMEHMASRECRISVGNISAVYIYSITNEMVMENFPIRYRSTFKMTASKNKTIFHYTVGQL